LDKIWQANAESHASDSKKSKLKPKVKFQYGGRLFSGTGSSNYLGRELRYLVEIWYDNSFPPF